MSMTSVWDELATPAHRDQLQLRAQQRRWPQALILIGWLHLLAFLLCYYLTIIQDYHEQARYLIVWLGELFGVGLIGRFCGRSAPASAPSLPLERFLIRVWIAYVVLAFNLGTLNTIRGHRLFELFPAMASLASLAFLVMTFAVSRRFYVAVLVMFIAGLLMATFLLHAYLIFALAWWFVLNGIGITLRSERHSSCRTLPAPVYDAQVQPDEQRGAVHV
jgi:hypothetical protein